MPNNDTQHHVATVKAKAKKKWLNEASKHMVNLYGIGLLDCADTVDQFYDRWADDGETSPEIAVRQYGEKYDLTEKGGVW